MSAPTRVREALLDRPFGFVAVALLLAAVVGVAAPFVLGATNLSILGLYVAIPMVVAPLLVWRLRTTESTLPQFDWRVWSVPFHALVAVLVFVLAITDVRPIAFYGGVAALYGLCFLLITTATPGRAGRAIVLYHLAVTFLLVVFSVTLNYAFFVGHTDLTGHVSMTTAIIETGSLPDDGTHYGSFQFWHVFVASAYALFGGTLAVHTTTYLLSGAVFAAGIGLVYGIARRLHPNETFALLASLAATLFPVYIFYGMYSIPRGVASIVFLALVLALVSRRSAQMRAMAAVFVAAIVIYHPVTILFVAVILGAVYAVERPIRTPTELVNWNVLSVALLLTITYWLYAAEDIVFTVVDVVVVTVFEQSADSGVPAGVFTSPWTEVANYVSYGFTLFFVLVGFLFWLRNASTEGATPGPSIRERHRAVALATIVLVTVLLVPLAFPGPTRLLDSVSGMNVDRFGHYSFAFVALTGGYGLYELVNRGGVPAVLALVVLVSCFGFTAVSNDFTASDNPVVERPFYAFYLTDQERQSFAAIDRGFDGELGSDRVSCRYLGEIERSTCTTVDSSQGEAMFDDYAGIVVREGELEDRPLRFTQLVGPGDIPRDELRERDRVFDSGSVAVYA